MKYKKYVLMLVWILFYLMCGWVMSVAQEDVSETIYKEGLKKYVLKDYEGAIKDFESALQLNPESIKVKNMYITTLVKQGNIAYEKGDYDKAGKYYQKAISLGSQDKELQDKLLLIKKSIEEKSAKALYKVKKPSGETALPEAEVVPTKIPPAAIEGQKPPSAKVVPSEAPPAVQIPIDINEFIRRQNEENKRILTQIIEAQREERQNIIQENKRVIDKLMEYQKNERTTLLENMKEMTNSQKKDREFFSRSLLMILAGGVFIVIVFLLVFLLFIRRVIRASRLAKATPEYSVSFSPQTLLEIPEKIDETKYLTDERYSDVVKAKRLRDLYYEFSHGEPTWDMIEEYIGELNSEIKTQLLDLVDDKLKSGEVKETTNAYQVLLPLVTDEDREIRTRSTNMLRELTTERSVNEEYSQIKRGSENPLGFANLYNMAILVDRKTGRPEHSTKVSEVLGRIAEALKDTNINPDEMRRIGLAHDVGYLEVPDTILKKKGELTEEEFKLIKTHPQKGVELLSNIVDLPPLFYEGIKYHHERINGSGYPEGLREEEIPLVARLVAVADFFSAVTSARPHRKAISIGRCFKMIRKLAGTILDEHTVYLLMDLYKNEME